MFSSGRKDQIIFYLFASIALVVVLWSSPFLHYPYDMIYHLMVIDDFYVQLTHPVQKMVGIWANDIYCMIPQDGYESIELARPRFLWHYLWAELFYLLDIDSTQMFLRAKIMHIIQTYISLFSIYYFSKVVIRNTFKQLNSLTLKWLSFWSVLIWLTIYATFSAAYHQVWLMWYSVNYQITLPLFWYMLGLTLVLLLEETSWKTRVFFALQIVLLSRFMLQVHSMEFLYYLMHMAVFGLVFIDKIYLLVKRYFYIVVPVILAIVYMAKHYQPEKSLIFSYLSWEKLPALYDKIMHEGQILLHGYNRASASVNELMVFIGIVGGLFLLYQLYLIVYKKIDTHIDTRMLIYITLTSLFVLIPLYRFSGGLFSLITYTMVVNRLYYSASLFVVLPIVIYGISSKFKLNLLFVNGSMIVLLLLVGIFSKHNDMVHHNYYKNIQSIKNSFYERKVGFNLSSAQIEEIGERLKSDKANNITGRPIRYYARADIAFVIKYIFHKNVYWKGRRANPDYIKIYKRSKGNRDFKQILFETPKGFPAYRPYE